MVPQASYFQYKIGKSSVEDDETNSDENIDYLLRERSSVSCKQVDFY